MKIIREGSVKPEQSLLRGECKRCGCVLECDEEEARFSSGPRDPYWSTRCPTERCGNAVYLFYVKT